MFRNISEGEYTSTIYGMIKEQWYSEAAAILQMEMPTIKNLLTETGGSCHIANIIKRMAEQRSIGLLIFPPACWRPDF